MDISKAKYFAHQDELNDTIIYAKHLETLASIYCYDIGLYGIFETQEGDVLFQIDFKYDGEPFVWRKLMHLDSFLRFYKNQDKRFLDKQSEKYITYYLKAMEE